MEIFTKYTLVQEKKVEAFKEKVRKLTKRNGGKPLSAVVQGLNPVLRGYANYFQIANRLEVFRVIMGLRRPRLRAIQLKLWKTPGRLYRRLSQLGYRGEFKSIKMSSWRSARSPLAAMAMPNTFFDELKLFNLEW